MIESRLRLYKRGLEVVRNHWRTDRPSELQRRVEGQIPEFLLFPLWNEVFQAKRDGRKAAEFATALDRTISSIDECLAGREADLSPSIVGTWSNTCVDYHRLRSGLAE